MLLNMKSCRLLLALTAMGAMTQESRGGCNCSVPPSPSASPGGAQMGSWSGAPGYGNAPGNMSPAAYGGDPTGQWSGAPGYGNAPGNMSPTAYGGDPTGQWSGTAGYGISPGSPSATASGAPPFQVDDHDTAGPHWAPGGYEARIGSPAYYHDPAGGQYVVTGNPYYDHFGPGFHRSSLHGHYRFPYYNYRAPWYFPGKSVYNRNTNFAW